MLLPPLLRAHAFMRIEAPPEIWEADTEDVDFVPLLGEMIAAALLGRSPLSDLTLAVANVVVPADSDPPEPLSALPPPGEYVAVTVRGPGAWSTEWSWVPNHASDAITIPPARLAGGRVCYAYGRATGDTASVTVFLRRRGPVSLPTARG